MAYLGKVDGRSVYADMSPEFEAQFEGALLDLLPLVNLEEREGRLFKWRDGSWHLSPPASGQAAFVGGWDSFDERYEINGVPGSAVMLYFASEAHRSCRRRAFAAINAAAPLDPAALLEGLPIRS